jgi:putative flippase GtrA
MRPENSAGRAERANRPAMKHFGPVQPVVDYLETAWRERAMLLKAISFAIVGLINMSVDIGMFSIFYGVLHLSMVTSNCLAWAIAVTGSYVMNSFFTFAHETGRELKLRSYATFVVSNSAGLLVNTGVLVLAHTYMPVWGAKGLATLASFVVNFAMSHFVVFRHRPRPSDIA